MSLDVIQPKDIPLGRPFYYKDYDLSLETRDIEKCQPYYRSENYLNKPNFQVGVTESGFDGARAKSYYPAVNRPRDLSLTTMDIHLARPKKVENRGNRVTDPLCPVYDLPKSQPTRPITPPRYNGRVTNDVSDIEFTKPSKVIPDRNYVRDPNTCSDIEYTCPNYHRRVVRPFESPGMSTSLNVQDINAQDATNPRCTNPLDPTYKVSQTTTTSMHHTFSEESGNSHCLHAPPLQPAEIGPIPGSKPRKLQWGNGEPQFSLMKEDIPGAAPQRWTGSVPYNVYDPPEKKAVISFHDPHDVPGAQVGSLRKGIESGRELNPLQPTYTFLDGKVVPTTLYTAQNALDAERGFPLRKSQSEAFLQTPSQRSNASGSIPEYRQPRGAEHGVTMTPPCSWQGKPPSMRSDPYSARSGNFATHQTMVPQLSMQRSQAHSHHMVPQSTRSMATGRQCLGTSRSCASLTRHQILDRFVGM